MVKSKGFSALLFFTLAAMFSLRADGQIIRERLITVAGELKIVQLDEGQLGNKYALILNDNVILRTGGDDEGSGFPVFPVPTILQRFRNGVRPYDEVILFQQNMWGNACDGGPLWFLGLNRNGSFFISPPIEFCGGRAPIIRARRDAVTIIIPGGPPNRGTGYIPGETWVYQSGGVRQIRNRNRRR